MIEITFPPVQIKSVLGKGNEKRWETFQDIFKKAFGNNSNLIENATPQKNLRYRLIVEKGGSSIGIFIFSNYLSNSFKKLFGLESVLRVQALHFASFNENFGKELIQLASSFKAKSIIANVSKKDDPLMQFMERIGFKKMVSVVTDDCYCYLLILKEKKESAESTSKNEIEDQPIEPNTKMMKIEIKKGQ